MSEENVEVIRRSVDAINRGMIEEALEFVDPESELHSAIVGGTEGNVYRGRDGFRRWWADSFGSFEELRTELTEFRDLGDRVLAFGHIHARGRESGLGLDSPTGWVFTVRDGKVLKAAGFLSRAETLEAAGLLKQPIPQEHIDIGLRQVDAVNRRDAEAFVATVSPEVEWEDSLYWSDVSRTYQGRGEVREWFNEAVVEPWESLQCGVEEIAEAADDRLFFGGLLTARGRDGLETRLHFWTVMWIADGKVTRREVFRDRADALEAAGLEE